MSQANQENQTKQGKRTNRARWIMRGTVCGACALALAVGTLTFQSQNHVQNPGSGDTENPDGVIASSLIPSFSFQLTAYAADSGVTSEPGELGSIALADGEGMMGPEDGDYTGCLFQVTGDGIKTLKLSLDRGGFYRYQLHTGLTDEEMANYREAMGRGEITTAAISQTDDGVWYMPEMKALGSSVTEEYDPEISYGFWISPEELKNQGDKTDMDQQQEWHSYIDLFDGAQLTITAVFENGTEQTKAYRLSSGKLRITQNEYGKMGVLPQLAGEDEPYIYGIYTTEVES